MRRRELLQRLDSSSAGDLVWDEGRRALGIDTGTRRRANHPARLFIEDGVVTHSEAGSVLEEWLVSPFIWNPALNLFESQAPYWYRPGN